VSGQWYPHKARIHFIVLSDRLPQAKEFRFVLPREFRRVEIVNDFLQVFLAVG